jgi:hypothetical protein
MQGTGLLAKEQTMYSKQLYFTLAILTVAASVQANAGQANPLHPGFYWDAAPNVPAMTSDVKSYIDSRNPLHPTYGHAASGSNWQSAVGPMGMAYRDSNNPLHPSFVR